MCICYVYYIYEYILNNYICVYNSVIIGGGDTTVFHSLIHQWILKLFTYLGYYKECVNEHGGAYIIGG